MTDDVKGYIELPEIYDGWSVAVMKDGTWRNRWPEGDPRHGPVADFIARHQQGGGDGG